MLRKMLKADAITEYKTDKVLPVFHDNVQVVGIGTRKDGFTKINLNGKEYTCEGI